jgi:tetratricopeptide (TPR) repeat protein
VLADLGDTDPERGWVEALTGLGLVELHQGLHEQAAGHLERARTVCREIGDRHCEADALVNLGLTEVRRGRAERAAELLERALAQCREIGHRLGEAEALAALGEMLLADGRPDQACDKYAAALDVAGRTLDVELEARARRGLEAAREARSDAHGGPAPRRTHKSLAMTNGWCHPAHNPRPIC